MYVFITTEKSAQNVAAETMPLNSWHKTQTERRLPLITFVSVSVIMMGIMKLLFPPKTSGGTTKKCESKNLRYFLSSSGTKREGLSSLTNSCATGLFLYPMTTSENLILFFSGDK